MRRDFRVLLMTIIDSADAIGDAVAAPSCSGVMSGALAGCANCSMLSPAANPPDQLGNRAARSSGTRNTSRRPSLPAVSSPRVANFCRSLRAV